MLDEVNRAKIVITNFHAFKLRETIELAKGGRQLLEGRTGDKLNTLETEGQMIQRVMPDLMGMKNILVINDEAHHCYREKPPEADDEELKGEDRKEAEKANEAARVCDFAVRSPATFRFSRIISGYAISRSWRGAEMSGKIVRLRQAKIVRNATSRSKGRRENNAYWVREHLTEAEMDKVLAALKRNRHGHWDWLIGLIIYRHGLRVSEACDLRWDDIDLLKRTIIVRRLKDSTDSVHYLERDELNGLRLLRRQQQAGGTKGAYVFINERDQPFGRMGIGRMIERAGGSRWAAVPVACPHAAAFDRIRIGGQGNGHKAAPALPGACLDHQYRALHGHVAGAIQGHLALSSTRRS
jgi:integrase